MSRLEQLPEESPVNVIGRTKKWEILDTPITDHDLEQIQAAVNAPLPDTLELKRARQVVEIMVARKNDPIKKSELMDILLPNISNAPRKLGEITKFLHDILENHGINCQLRIVAEERGKHSSRTNFEDHTINRPVKFYHTQPKQ